MNIKTWIAAMAAAACGAVTAAGASPLDISYEEIPLEKIKAEDTLIYQTALNMPETTESLRKVPY